MAATGRYRLDQPFRVTIDYADIDGRIARHRITLHGITCLTDEVVLQAWCNISRARRDFRTDRIKGVIDERGIEQAPTTFALDIRSRIETGAFGAVLLG